MTAIHQQRALIGVAALAAWVVLVLLYAYGLLAPAALVVLAAAFVYSLIRFERAARDDLMYDRENAHHFARLIGWTGGALAVAILVVFG